MSYCLHNRFSAKNGAAFEQSFMMVCYQVCSAVYSTLQSCTETEMSAESICMLFSAIEGAVICRKPRRVGQFASVCMEHVYAWW